MHQPKNKILQATVSIVNSSEKEGSNLDEVLNNIPDFDIMEINESQATELINELKEINFQLYLITGVSFDC